MVRYRLAVSQIAVTAATRRTCRVCFSPLKTEPFHIAVRSVFRRIEAVGEKKREREGGREGERERLQALYDSVALLLFQRTKVMQTLCVCACLRALARLLACEQSLIRDKHLDGESYVPTSVVYVCLLTQTTLFFPTGGKKDVFQRK